MKTYSFNDKMGSRSLSHRNFIVAGGLALEFVGKNLPGCRIVREDFSKNGKWSHSTWDVELADEISVLVFSQDWDTGKWFPEKTWELACSRSDLAKHFSPEQAERFIRRFFPQNAVIFDEERASQSAPIDVVSAFQELSAESQEEAELRAEKARLAVQAKKAKEAQGKKYWLENRVLPGLRQQAKEARELVSRETEILEALKEAQEEVSRLEAEVKVAEDLRKKEAETVRLKKQAEVLKKAKGQKMSLADLQSALKSV
jgi:hypothetical protein